ncbi:MAG TPA: oligosaccharide flippase family protein [Gaiellaceae bacterium]|nr:oligosaccharide flippase family protein [Gaiellaceae bacterium]
MTAAERTPLAATAARGVGIAAGGQLLTFVISLGSYLVLARLASPREFGQLAAGSIVVGVGTLVSESGMLAALVQRRDRVEEAASTAFVATVAGGILMSLVALGLAPVVGLFYHNRTIGLVAAALSGVLVVRQTMVAPDAIMQRRFSFVRRVILEPSGGLLGAGAAIAGTAAGLGVWGLVIGIYATMLTQAVLCWAMIDWRPSLRLASFGMWRELARFGRNVIAGESIRRLDLEARTAIVGRLVGVSDLGQYTYAYRMILIPLGIVVNGASYVLLPVLARISDDEERFRAAVLRSLRWMALLGFPTSLVLIPLGHPLLVVFFGARWRPAGDAVPFMALFGAAGAVVSLAAAAFDAVGRPSLVPRMHLLTAVVGVSLSAALSGFGLRAVAAAVSVGGVAGAAYALYGISLVTGLRLRALAAELVRPAVAALLSMGAAWGLEIVLDPASHRTPVAVALFVSEGAAAFVALLLALAVVAPASFAELERVLRMFGKPGPDAAAAAAVPAPPLGGTRSGL